MKQILSDHRRQCRGMIVSSVGLAVLLPTHCVLNIINAGRWDSALGRLLVILAVFAEIMVLLTIADIFVFTPRKLKKHLNEMREEERNEILAEYPNAKCVDGHRYMENHFVFYSVEKLYLLRYSDVLAIEKYGARLRLTVNGYKKPITMPFTDYGTNAVALAFLRGKNPGIKIISPERTE
ncbi:MAG: hypothetical protein ACI4KA_00410 [Oscillospiraceae bacterium]